MIKTIGTDLAEWLTKFVYCFDIARRGINGRAVKRNIGGRRSVEVRRRLHLDDLDFYYRVLGAGLRALLRILAADLRR